MRARWTLAAVAAAMAIAVVVGGCGQGGALTQGGPLATSTATPPAVATAMPAASQAVVTPAPTLPMPSGAVVTLDPSLLALLPATVGGATVHDTPESYTEAIKDPAFVASVDRAAFPIAVSGGDLVSGVVTHIRPGVYSDAFYADWRATYDTGACAQAGGVVAHAQQTVGGRTTYVTTCAGGARVYHTYLPKVGVLVSLLSVGSQDFGAQLSNGITG